MADQTVESICVLGGGGFLGSHLVRALLEQTTLHVIALDRRTERLADMPSRLVVDQADITEPGVLERAVDRADLLVSTTALCNPAQYNTRPVEVIDGSYTHLAPLVDRCTERGRWLVHFSTCEVYGRGEQRDGEPLPMSEEQTPLVLGPVQRERWSYACAKQLLERRIFARGRHDGLRFVILRPFNVIGPWMDYIPGLDGEGTPRVLACFMRALLFDEPLMLVDGGQQRRSFMYVDDFVHGVLRVVERRESCQGQILNLGNPDNHPRIADLAAELRRLYIERFDAAHSAGTHSVSAGRFYGEGYDDVPARVPDIARAIGLLDWRPSTTLQAMLPLVLDDYVARYGVRAARESIG